MPWHTILRNGSIWIFSCLLLSTNYSKFTRAIIQERPSVELLVLVLSLPLGNGWERDELCKVATVSDSLTESEWMRQHYWWPWPSSDSWAALAALTVHTTIDNANSQGRAPLLTLLEPTTTETLNYETDIQTEYGQSSEHNVFLWVPSVSNCLAESSSVCGLVNGSSGSWRGGWIHWECLYQVSCLATVSCDAQWTVFVQSKIKFRKKPY